MGFRSTAPVEGAPPSFPSGEEFHPSSEASFETAVSIWSRELNTPKYDNAV